ncbi:MAG: VCBS repeat-containing protein [Actinomycetota bacterium]|nr:VCBS repeat-containing protein [Actinomycetota bacterium]
MRGSRTQLGALLMLLCACGSSAEPVSNELRAEHVSNAIDTPAETTTGETAVGATATTTTVAHKEDATDFDVTISAPERANGYSEIEIQVASEQNIVAIEIISDLLVSLSSTKNSVIVRTPIVQQNQVIDYWIQVSTADGDSKRMSQQIEVVLYEHDVKRTRHLNPVDLEGTSTEDYAVFNFGFETVFVNERYNETYCYPTLDNCNDLGGSFTADAHNMMVGDFNGDGHQDLVVGWVIFPHTLSHKERSTVRVYLNDGTGRLTADPTIYSSGEPPERNMAYRIVVDDFNLDGVDDIFAGSQGLLRLLPSGERVNDMDPHILLLSRDGKLFDASDTIDYRDTIFFAHDASSGDINGDEFPDILAARTLFLNDGGAGFVNSIENLPEGLRRNDHYVMSSLLEDFNGDGLADPVLFWGDEPDSLNPRPAQIAISDKQKPSAQWEVHSLPTGPFGPGTTKFNHAATADIDGDGDTDIVIGTTRAGSLYYVGRFMQILRNDGSGNFTDISQDAMGEQPRALNHKDPEVEVQCTVWGEGQVVLLDIDNDGDIDITDRTNGGAQGAKEACPGIEIYLNDGNGSFSRDESSQLAWVRQHQIPGFVALTPAGHQIGNAIPIDLDGRFGIDYVAQIRSPWGGIFSFLYQVMSLR